MKKYLCALAALCLLAGALAACGGGEASSTPNPASQTQSVSMPAQPVEEPYEAELLTGLEKGDDYPEGIRPVAIMVNNISNNSANNARPQAGLSEADVLVEIKVEGGITRFMAIYPNYETIPRVGPVRSARDQFFQLILPFHMMYVHVGESIVQGEYRVNYDYDDFNLDADVWASLGHRDSEFRSRGVNSEHTFVTSGEEIAATIQQGGYDVTIDPYKSTIFDFVDYDEAPRQLTGGEAKQVDIYHSQTYRTYFDWDEAAGKYLMSQYSSYFGGVQPSTDLNNGEQLAFDNLLVLFTDIHTYAGHEATDLQEVDYRFGGYGCYFSGGRVEMVRWQKGTADQVLRITDYEGYGENVKINPGKSYIAVVDLDEAERFSYNPAARGQETESTVDSGADFGA